jgi:GAF domain-containing protein
LQIDPAALAASIGELHDLDLERGLTATLQQVVMAARTLFGADGAGLMLADADGELRWASATDQQSQLVEEAQERLGKGPCRVAFSQWMAIAVQNAGTEPDPDGSRSVLRNSGFQAALSVPVELHGGPIGSLDLYSAQPRDWDDSEVSALQAYAGIVANLLGSAAAAHVRGRLADQLQAALAHGAVIEQAKGALMEREGLDAQPPMNGCGRRPDPQAGRSPTWPATCWPAHHSLQPSRSQSKAASAARPVASSPTPLGLGSGPWPLACLAGPR